MPEGRSRVPLASEWIGLAENTVRGSTRNNCVTRRVREWQRISCIPPYRGGWTPTAITLESGPAEAMVVVPSMLNNRAASIYGGSNEIQRGIMAKLVLGL